MSNHAQSSRIEPETAHESPETVKKVTSDLQELKIKDHDTDLSSNLTDSTGTDTDATEESQGYLTEATSVDEEAEGENRQWNQRFNPFSCVDGLGENRVDLHASYCPPPPEPKWNKGSRYRKYY